MTDISLTPPATNPALQFDETVDITIRGARVTYVEPGPDGVTSFQLPSGPGPEYLAFNLDNPAVTFTRSVPIGGEPKPGDLWRDRHGKVYAAVLASEPWEAAHEAELILRPANGLGRSGPWRDIHADPLLGPISLEYRPVDKASRDEQARVAQAALSPDSVEP